MKTNKILAVALSAGLVLGGASVAHAGASGGAGGSTAEQPVDPDALNAAKTEAIYKLMAAGKSIDEANAIVRDAKTIDELNTAVEKALNPTPDPNPNPDPNPEADADALNEAKTEAIYKLMGAGKSIDEANAIVRDAKTIDELNKAVEKALNPTPDTDPEADMKENTDAEAAADKLNQAKTDAIYDLIAAGITNDFYHQQIEKAKTIEGVEALKNEILKSHEASKPKTSLDDWQIAQNEKDGYFTKEDALRAGNLALEKAGLKGLYKVEAVKNAVQKMWFWRFVPVEASEEKPGESIPWTPLTPANPINPSTPWTPLTPAEPIVPGRTDDPILGGDDKVVLPEEKPEDNKGTEIEEEKPKEGKDKEEKAKPSKDKKEEAKPAKQKGNNPKTGLVGLAPIYSTLAISMAGIVAARKKND